MSGDRPNVALVLTRSNPVDSSRVSGPGWTRFDRTYGPVGGAEQVASAIRSDLEAALPAHTVSSRADLGIGGGRMLGRVRKRRPKQPWLLVDTDLDVLDLLPVGELLVVVVGLPAGNDDPLHESALLVDLHVHVPSALAESPGRMRWVRTTDDVGSTVARLVAGGDVAGGDLMGPERHRRVERTAAGSSIEVLFPLKRRNDPTAAGEFVLTNDDGSETIVPPSSADHPMRAVTVVVDFDEFEHNLAASPDVQSGAIELEVIDNRDNAAGDGIAGLYANSATAAADGPALFVHPDVYLPAGWVDRTRTALADLDERDPDWAVAGIAGRLRGSIDAGDTGRGRWSDPHGYRTFGELPMPVDVLDELILITRDRSVGFDPGQPGFHCYGTDLAATAQEAERTIWVIDNWAWHKRARSDGSLLTHADRSGKITNRAEVGFTDEFTLSAAWVRDKWAGRRPLQGMTEYWRDFYGEG